MSTKSYRVLVWFKDKEIEQQVLKKLNENIDTQLFEVVKKEKYVPDETYHILVTDLLKVKDLKKIPNAIFTIVYKNIHPTENHDKSIIYSDEINSYPLRIKGLKKAIDRHIQNQKTEASNEKEEQAKTNYPAYSNTKKENDKKESDDEEKNNGVEDKEEEDHSKKNDSTPSSVGNEDGDIEQLADRSRIIQRQALLGYDFQPNQTIAVWSPLARMGVTTFIINYAVYLAENKVNTAVLEGPSSSHYLKNELKRFTTLPEGWQSYASVLHGTNEKTSGFQWNFEGVSWFPLGQNDMNDLTWTQDSMHFYIKNIKKFDITMIDMPSGKMDTPTQWLLREVDELWILVDDSIPHLCSYKQYMKELFQDYPNVKIHLIFNKYFSSFSQPKRVSEELEYPILATLPDMHETIKRNYYTNHLLIKKSKTRKYLMEGFPMIYQHLVGCEEPKQSWLQRLKYLVR